MFQLGRSFRWPSLTTTRLWFSTVSLDSSFKSEPELVPIQGVVKQPVNSSIFQPYDVIVVGGGHAGCEGN
jgi:hypothetical protein